METYTLREGQVDSGKYKGIEVTFRKISAIERNEVIAKARKSRKIDSTGKVTEADIDDLNAIKDLIALTIATPLELKKPEEFGKLGTEDYDNLAFLAYKINPLDFRPTLSDESQVQSG